MCACHRSFARALLTLTAVAVWAVPALAQPAPPTIHSATLDAPGGSTTQDRHMLTMNYTHPAMHGVPPPFYRIRTWPATRPPVSWGTFQENTAKAWRFPVVLNRTGMTDPIPGPHTVEIQVRDSLGQESNVATVVVTRVVVRDAAPAAGTVLSYRIRGLEVATLMGESRSAGYLLHAEAMTPNSECRAYSVDSFWTLYVKAANPFGATGPVAPRCRFRFFAGKTLRQGWTIRSVNLESVPGYDMKWVYESAIKSGTADASFAIVATRSAAPAGHGFLRVTEVVLDGPLASNWRQAFRPQ